MEKRTILAVVLSIVVISGFYLVQSLLFPPADALPAQTTEAPAGSVSPTATLPAAETGAAESTGSRPAADIEIP
jgi:hypothetical protein